MAEDCILKQAILKLFVTLNGEKKKIFVWGYTYFEKYNIALAKLVPVPNRTLEFKIPKTPRKQGKVPISLTNRDNAAVFII